MTEVDAVVLGSGPNGLASAITLAEAGLSVTVLEGTDTPGGGCRTEESTLPGFRHDVCSAVHPLVLMSPFFRRPAFDRLHEALRQPDIPVAHPLDGGRAAVAQRSVVDTAASLGDDGPAYLRLMAPLVRESRSIGDTVLGPLRTVPAHPVAVARFGSSGILPAERLARRFDGDEARALIAGMAAHSMSPLAAPLTSAFGLLLASAAHAVGWPVVERGSEAITAAMVGELQRLGGIVNCGRWIDSLSELPAARTVVLDLAPAGLLRLAGS
jgi:phytoene dehydrogenase-like protein